MMKGKVAGACFIAVFVWWGSVAVAQTGTQTDEKPAKTVTELATALLAAKTDQEQDSLLAANKELVKQELFDAIYQAGLAFSDKRAWPQSLNGYQVAIKIARLLGSKSAEGKALAGIGSDLFYQGKYDQSLDYFQKSLAIRREANDKDGIGAALRQIAKIYRRTDNYARALEYLNQAQPLMGEIKSKNIIADIEFEFGAVYFTRADYAAAVPRFQSALKIYREIEFKSGVSAALDALAATYTDLGDFVQAIDFAQRALAQAGDNKGATGRVLTNLGVTYGQQGNYNKAIECLEQALQLARESGDTNVEAATLGNIGLVQYQQRNYAQALDYYQRALDLADKEGAKAQVAEILTGFGVLYAERGDYEKAVDYYQRALLIGREIKNDLLIGETLASLGEVFYHQGNFDKSISAAQESLILFQKLGYRQKIIGANDNLALVYLAQNKNEAALQALTESLAIEKTIGASEYTWKTFNNLGLTYRSLKRNEDAEKAFLESANAVERLRNESESGAQQQQNFLQGRTEPYQNLVDLLVEEHRTTEALSQAEQVKARLLLDVLHSGRVQITNAMTAVEKEQERSLNYDAVSLNTQIYNENAQDKPDQPRLASLKERLQKARLNQQEFQTRLYAAHPDLKTQRAAVDPFTLAQASALLTDPQIALLEYQFAKDKVFLFVVTRDAQAKAAVTVYTLKVTGKELETLAGKYREQLATRDALFKETSAQLYALLVGPAQTQVHGKTKLVIVPDGVLWELPFQALTTEKKTYLIEDYAISYMPSLSVAVEMAKKQRARKPVAGSPTLLAFGNPSLGKEKVSAELFRTRAGSFSQLPEAENEVHQLEALYGRERSAVFTGSAARESELKARAGAFRVIHLATHGILNDASPMYSQIVLSQEAIGKDEDGLLEAWEIIPLNLNADLVVLSACETARGRVSEGEGMIGLSWALFVAGVPTTLVSQWKVDSASTSQLMFEFHRQLLGNHSKAESLRLSTLKLMRDKQYNHPFYWAAFVVVGDGN